jgi:hypothetical protein
VRIADRAHLDDLAVDELDAFVAREDAGLDHPFVLFDREQAARGFDLCRHLNLWLAVSGRPT